MQRTDRTIYLEMHVRSAIKPMLLKRGIIEHGKTSQAKERQLIGSLAGAMAEELCEQYRDTLEPSGVARSAIEAYDELIEENPVLNFGDELPRDADLNKARMAQH